jgi:transposase-like protein
VNPHSLFCPNDVCPSRGQTGLGNIVAHSKKEGRYKCKTCQKTFAQTKLTAFYRLHKERVLLVIVVTLLAYGCPPQAIVAAFGLDERTVLDWQEKAGKQCERVHDALITQQPRDLKQVQADEIRVKCRRGLIVWMAMAMQSATRLWLGGVVSPTRDAKLIDRLAQKVKACARMGPILLLSDGLASYVSAWRKAFRTPVRTGRVGRPVLLAWPDVFIGQVIKQYQKNHVVGVVHRLIQGTKEQIDGLLASGQQINTAYIERLNATFRAHLCCLVRRVRALAAKPSRLQAGMYLLGTVYNFCTPHQSLRLEGGLGARKWAARTPAMAASITDHCWCVCELLGYRVAPAPYVAPKRRGRKPKSVPPTLLGAAI